MISIEEESKQLLSTNNEVLPPNCLFMSCCFHLVGFEEDEWMNTTCSHNTTNSINDSSSSLLGSHEKDGKGDLLRLIRRGMGTIFWDVHESVTHVIVADGSDAKTR